MVLHWRLRHSLLQIRLLDKLGEAICEPAFQSGALVALPIVLQGLADWFVRKADVGLVEADEPEKARKLAKTLSAFLHVGPGGAADSLDV